MPGCRASLPPSPTQPAATGTPPRPDSHTSASALGTLSDADFERLDAIWWSNNQLYNGVLPTRAMKPFYEQSGRAWPPARRRVESGQSTSPLADVPR